MEMSVREVRAAFAAAIAAVEQGERVTITKHGKPVAELGPPAKPKPVPIDWNELDRLQEALGIPTPTPEQSERLERWFNNPDSNRQMLGLDDDWEPYRP